MKLTNYLKSAVFIGAMVFTVSALAVTPDEDDRKECKKPKFRDFAPAHQAEVPPESELSFHISRGADPNAVTVEVKGEKVPVKVNNRVTFMVATAKLPASLREGFARIHVAAKAADGECVGSDGWLIKVAPAGGAVAAPAAQAAAPAAQSVPVPAAPAGK